MLKVVLTAFCCQSIMQGIQWGSILITSIYIENFLIIEGISISPNSGFTVFTGESGSGKSLVFKALRFALGGKIDKSYIGQWKDQATIRITGKVTKQLNPVFNQYGIPVKGIVFSLDHCLSKDKRICHINGKKISIRGLKDIAKSLILDSEQGQHTKLQDLNFQNEYLDSLVKQYILDEFNTFLAQLSKLNQSKRKMQLILETEDEAWLLHQIEELDKVLPDERIVADLQALVDESQKTELVKKEWMGKKDHIQSLRKGVLQLKQIQSVELDDLILEIQASLDAIEQVFQVSMGMDVQAQYEASEAKIVLSKLKDMARKHKSHPGDLHTLLASYKNTWATIEAAKQDMGAIEQSIIELEKRLVKVSEELKEAQLKQADQLTKHITKQLVLMGMEQASFRIDFHENGYRVYPVFMIKSNPGQPFKMIQDCLSGGEMARLSILLTIYQNPHLTLILDEVDTGVSGTVGIRIRNLLKNISKRQQILCISHLAQVASGADSHFVLEKEVVEKIAKTKINTISGQDRAVELSRLMCGHIDEEMVSQTKRLLILNE